MERVKINGKLDRCFYSSNIKINNFDLKFVKSIDFHIDDEKIIPKINICIDGIPDIDVMADVEINPSPRNLQEACLIIAHEIQKHGEFYDAYKDSVLSVFKENRIIFAPEGLVEEIADKIVKRISGEE